VGGMIVNSRQIQT